MGICRMVDRRSSGRLLAVALSAIVLGSDATPEVGLSLIALLALLFLAVMLRITWIWLDGRG